MEILYVGEFSMYFNKYEGASKEERRELAEKDPEATIYEPEVFADWFNFGRFPHSGRLYIV